MAECIVNCIEHPDAVDKINWKCVECERDLEQDCKDIWAKREEAAKARAEEVAKNAPKTLSDDEIAKRRRLAES